MMKFPIRLLSRRNAILILLSTALCFFVGGRLIGRYLGSDGQFCLVNRENDTDSYAVIEKTIDARSHTLLVADTPQKWQRGLMDVRGTDDICGYDGMIFTFPLATPQIFWNKNTLVDLDIYWMKGGTIVGQSKLPATTKSGLTTISSPMAVDKVVEIIR